VHLRGIEIINATSATPAAHRRSRRPARPGSFPGLEGFSAASTR
jgi:hypothetical protein